MHQTQPSARESQSRIWTQLYVTPKTGFPLASKFWNFYSTVEYRGRKNLERPHCLQPMSQAFCLHRVGKIILSSLGILRMITTKGWLQWCAGKCLTLLSKEKKKQSNKEYLPTTSNVLICSICWFLSEKAVVSSSNHSWFQVTSVKAE